MMLFVWIIFSYAPVLREGGSDRRGERIRGQERKEGWELGAGATAQVALER